MIKLLSVVSFSKGRFKRGQYRGKASEQVTCYKLIAPFGH